jgi:hypothetical protein
MSLLGSIHRKYYEDTRLSYPNNSDYARSTLVVLRKPERCLLIEMKLVNRVKQEGGMSRRKKPQLMLGA